MNDYQTILQRLNKAPRPEQQALCNDIVDVGRFGECLLAQADTGIGKTLATAIAVKRLLNEPSDTKRKVVIATSSLSLCKDINHCFDSIDLNSAILMSYRNYFSEERIALLAAQHPALKDVLQPLLKWPGTIESYITEHGSLPDGVSISQVCQTHTTRSEKYDAQRNKALESQIVITSHAMIAVDVLQYGQILGLKHDQTSLIIDEADAFVDLLKSFDVRHFNLYREFAAVRSLMSSTWQEKLSEQGDFIRKAVGNVPAFSAEAKKTGLSALKVLSKALGINKRRGLSLIDCGKLSDFEQHLQSVINQVSTSNDVSISLTSVNKEPTITIFAPYFSRVFGHYCKGNIHSLVLMSGTLSVDNDVKAGTEWIKRELKLDGLPIVRKAYSPKRFGTLSLSLYRSDVALYEDDSEGALNPALVSEICLEVNKFAGKTLIITASFAEAELYAKYLHGQVLVHTRNTTLTPLKNAFVAARGKVILISPSAHTGLNFTDPYNRSVINHICISRLGFSPSNTALASLKGTPDFPQGKISALMQADYFMNLNRVIRRTKQVIGRGIRHADDNVHVFIADKRFPRFIDINNKHAPLRNVIPERFTPQYQQANIIKPVEYAATSDTALDLSVL